MKKENEVQIIDIWMPVENGGEAVRFDGDNSTNMKLVVRLANGLPLLLDKDWCMEKRIITEREAEEVRKGYRKFAPLNQQQT